ncbi:response regulator [Actinoplanes sp. CA-030573]|uniref:response regulator n=1 Tax=Actinoplanes sp. CA-030573 TaxID=3239898 RepID=UPI003D8A1585
MEISNGTGRISVAVVEDHPLVRDAIVRLLRLSGKMDVVAYAGSVEALPGAEVLANAIVVLDLHLPGRSGPRAVHYCVSLGLRVVALSAWEEREEVMAALNAGAKGFVPKSADSDQIVWAVEAVAAGGNYVSPALAAALLGNGPSSMPVHIPALSERERDVVALLAAGERDHDIAVELGISVRTVRSHLDRIRQKTGRRRRPDLTRFAMEEGIVRRMPIPGSERSA